MSVHVLLPSLLLLLQGAVARGAAARELTEAVAAKQQGK